jgi:hypothetical protein
MGDELWVHVVTLSVGRSRPEHEDFRFQIAGDKRYNLFYGRGIKKPVCNNRNTIVAEFLANPEKRANYLLMMDNDVAPHGNVLDYVEYDKDIVVFPCPIWQLRQDVNEPLIYNITVAGEHGTKLGVALKSSGGLVEISEGGTGAILIARRVLEHPDMRHPFREVLDEFGVSHKGHDLSFCERAREAGFKVWAALGCTASHWQDIDLAVVHTLYQRERQKAAGRFVPPRESLRNKKLIFCLSPGRCGTRYLSKTLDTIPGVGAFHEPEPSFVHSLQRIQSDPGEAYRFWLYQKIPAILENENDTYIETSSLFGKGYAVPLLDMGVIPDILVIRRPHREVALSMWRRDAWPGRTISGSRFHNNPGQVSALLPIADWSTLSDYQVCYWFALEMEERSQRFSAMFKRQGAVVVETTLDELVTQEGFYRILQELGLPDPGPEYHEIWQEKENETHESLLPKMPEGDLDEQEAEVVARIAVGA